MENASKAMIIVAAMIIAVMVLSLMVYLFVQAGRVPAQYEYTKQAEEIAAYNAKLEQYSIIADISGDGLLKEEELNGVSNSFSDVISVCNLAYDVNCKNDNDSTNNIIVEFSIDGNSYCVYPKKDERGASVLEKDKVFCCSSSQENLMTKDNMKNLYDIMDEGYNGFKFNEARYDSLNRLRYKYYFDCELDYGLHVGSNSFKNNGKITKINFTLVENGEY